ncbi:carboxylate--amine ligase [Natronorubrum thiooxidans]|uniref:Predicted ATP-dependent carboligase, ATP-grasp superfamily n=1 Tax=Natronorubrum thiooxidans TaxID=308853 RepID=A0A1N7FS57_9EURY|nr:ATP-grasp domain-containing protein [Natronorubrum thiooxidans]SIS03150.1 Predicted ATP-dependent carboligase, ATP-grasp superfamily [Natronorubrum thiooxidans]
MYASLLCVPRVIEEVEAVSTIMDRVFVLDAHAKHGLVAIRSLGNRGFAVTAGSSIRWNAGKTSKYVSRCVTYPKPAEKPGEFVRSIEQELQDHDYGMILPVDQKTVEVVVRHKSQLEEHTNVPFLPYDQLKVGLDKEATIKAARRYDIPHPKSRLSDEIDLDSIESTLGGYPVVVKPRRGSGGKGVSVCDSHEELVRVYRRTLRQHGPVILQEFIPNGGERGVYTMYDRSSTLSGITVQHRLRSRPPGGGASTFRETISDPELVAISDRLLSSLGWQGVAMAEYRYDRRDGEPKLMEINPRLWGSLALSVFAGVDFPYLLYRFATDEPLEQDLTYDVGVQARSLFHDWLQAMERENRLVAMREFFTPSSKPCCYDIVSKDDPLPILGQIGYWFSLYKDSKTDGDGIEPVVVSEATDED